LVQELLAACSGIGCEALVASRRQRANGTLRSVGKAHLGGVNVGFLDGHATWLNSEKLIAMVKDGDIEGLAQWGPVSDCIFEPGVTFGQAYPGVPTLW